MWEASLGMLGLGVRVPRSRSRDVGGVSGDVRVRRQGPAFQEAGMWGGASGGVRVRR
jgi:hypothetical protein